MDSAASPASRSALFFAPGQIDERIRRIFHRNMLKRSSSNQIVNALIDQSEIILSFQPFCPIQSIQQTRSLIHILRTTQPSSPRAHDNRIEINLVPARPFVARRLKKGGRKFLQINKWPGQDLFSLSTFRSLACACYSARNYISY